MVGKFNSKNRRWLSKQMFPHGDGVRIANGFPQGKNGQSGTRIAKKCFRINSYEICSPDLHKESISDLQQSFSIISLENGGYLQPRTYENYQVKLILSYVSWDHDYCGMFIQQIEFQSWLGVSECQRFLRQWRIIEKDWKLISLFKNIRDLAIMLIL